MVYQKLHCCASLCIVGRLRSLAAATLLDEDKPNPATQLRLVELPAHLLAEFLYSHEPRRLMTTDKIREALGADIWQFIDSMVFSGMHSMMETVTATGSAECTTTSEPNSNLPDSTGRPSLRRHHVARLLDIDSMLFRSIKVVCKLYSPFM